MAGSLFHNLGKAFLRFPTRERPGQRRRATATAKSLGLLTTFTFSLSSEMGRRGRAREKASGGEGKSSFLLEKVIKKAAYTEVLKQV